MRGAHSEDRWGEEVSSSPYPHLPISEEDVVREEVIPHLSHTPPPTLIDGIEERIIYLLGEYSKSLIGGMRYLNRIGRMWGGIHYEVRECGELSIDVVRRGIEREYDKRDWESEYLLSLSLTILNEVVGWWEDESSSHSEEELPILSLIERIYNLSVGKRWE